MTPLEQILSRVGALTGTLDAQRSALMELLCVQALSFFTARLREGVTQEQCQEELVTAASLLVLAGLGYGDDQAQLQQFQVGDLAVRHSAEGSAAALEDLRRRAMELMAPYLAQPFVFQGV